jgi:hypothetical protein
VNRFFSSGDLAILGRYGADWLVVDRTRFRVRPQWPLAFRDEHYSLYHRPG